MIIGKEREVKEFKKYVGVGEFHILGFNFSREEIIQNCGYDPGNEQEYVKNKDGIAGNTLTAFLREKNLGVTMKVSFPLWNKLKVSDSGNPRFVNVKCLSNYGSPLPEWFAKHEHRQAFDGEAEFLSLMRAWLSNFDWFDDGEGGAKFPLKETSLIIGGNVNGLNGLTKKYSKQTVGVLCGIRTTEMGDKQDACNRAFLPGYLVNKIQNLPKGMAKEEVDKQTYLIRKFIETVEGEYGYKNFYSSYRFSEYDPNTNVVSGNNSAIINSNNEISY